MDNPDDDYLSDSELYIRDLSANLQTANYEIGTLRERLVAAEHERDMAVARIATQAAAMAKMRKALEKYAKQSNWKRVERAHPHIGIDYRLWARYNEDGFVTAREALAAIDAATTGK